MAIIKQVSILAPMIKKWMREDYDNELKRTRPSPSKAGYCALKVFRQFSRDEKTDMDETGLWNVWKGSTLHDGIAQMIARRGNECMTGIKQNLPIEFVTPCGNKVKGELDLTATLSPHTINDEPYVIDWKFPTARGFSKTKADGMPHQHYVDQILIYCYAMNIKHAILMYFGEFSQSLEFEIDYDPKRVDYILGKLDDIFRAYELEKTTSDDALDESEDADMFPKDNIPEAGWECKYCQYKAECKDKGII